MIYNFYIEDNYNKNLNKKKKELKMSAEEERQAVEYFLEWVKGGSFAQWIEHFLNQGDEGKLRQVKEVYDKIKQVFGF